MSERINEKETINSLKNEVARELGVQFQEDNGHLTSRECGSVGGGMVKKMVEQYKGSVK
ncbi:alpha/beta-type small acid-soluble spore protein [Clostridium sp.]|uniref:alpha/beta-type small acid-soluble spore protein n=1 Tax=Clostridium sp. TaxID=1506 RepID=UPI002635029E|nr:alpha/beta-type small acid-soluble spore protein [Clostridium sp.]